MLSVCHLYNIVTAAQKLWNSLQFDSFLETHQRIILISVMMSWGRGMLKFHMMCILGCFFFLVIEICPSMCSKL